MSENPPIQFDRAEYSAAPARLCSNCGNAVSGEYYEIGGNMVCARCAAGIKATLDEQDQSAGVLRAAGAGAAAALAGAVVYGAVRYTGYEFSLIAILVGYLVGRAVRWGSGGRGGRRYQAIAMVLTYISITASALPYLWREVVKDGGSLSAVQYLFLFVLSLWMPFAEGWRNILGIAILGIGLWEAWRLNKRVKVEVTGPYTLAPEEPARADG